MVLLIVRWKSKRVAGRRGSTTRERERGQGFGRLNRRAETRSLFCMHREQTQMNAKVAINEHSGLAASECMKQVESAPSRLPSVRSCFAIVA